MHTHGFEVMRTCQLFCLMHEAVTLAFLELRLRRMITIYIFFISSDLVNIWRATVDAKDD